ncbi:hypothetical protein CAEBREN_10116 [Caenorhabditis brenneri]|uniref:F-box domain-containing protein n=1 Tax=Caenorhabditis brenneri TaxID=135651 RepID=G0N3P3_CAEBE|nr:hypothetical protein CAEBREN_10116 [Caenorhabditis brenneri]
MSLSKFSLLNLPDVAFRVVADFWTPFELLDFSTITKRTKRKAIDSNKKAYEIDLNGWPCQTVSIMFDGEETSIWKTCFISEEAQKTERDDDEMISRFQWKLVPGNCLQEAIKQWKFSMEIFKYSRISVSISPMNSTLEDRKILFDLMNSTSDLKDILSLKIDCITERDMDFVFNNCNINLAFLFLSTGFDNKDYKPHQTIKTKNILIMSRITFNILRALDSVYIRSLSYNVTSEDVNGFLKDWQSSQAYCSMKKAEFYDGHWNLNELLEGTSSTSRDPRTVKRSIKVGANTHWIFGGFDIQRKDGVTATLQLGLHRMKSGTAKVPEELIKDYEDFLKNDDPVEGHGEDGEQPKRRPLYVYVW